MTGLAPDRPEEVVPWSRGARGRPLARTSVSGWHDPARRAARGHWGADLYLADLAAVSAAHLERQTHRALPGKHHSCDVDHPPLIAPAAICMQFMLAFVEARDVAEVDHANTVAPSGAHQTSYRAREQSASGQSSAPHAVFDKLVFYGPAIVGSWGDLVCQ